VSKLPNIIAAGTDWTEKREDTPVDTKPAIFSLSDMSEDWHFFNHGAFFSFAEFNYPVQDPVADWYAQQPLGTEVLLQPFTKPVFDGLIAPTYLGNLTWDNIICGVKKERWQSLWEHLGGICAINTPDHRFYRAFSGDLEIADPVLAERHSILYADIPQITVTVFCVDGNMARWEVRPAISPIGQPRIVKMPPRQDVMDMAEAVFRGDTGALTAHKNPAFQPLLDEYKRAQQVGPTIIGSHNEDNT